MSTPAASASRALDASYAVTIARRLPPRASSVICGMVSFGESGIYIRLPPEGGSYESHGGSYESHGGSYESHGGSYESHGGSYESHGGSYESRVASGFSRKIRGRLQPEDPRPTTAPPAPVHPAAHYQ